jgi:flagellar motor switch protein FliN/FliY
VVMTALEEAAFLGDIPIALNVELDRKKLTVREILDLEPGSVIKMPRSAGENIDILVGETLIASGEIVIIEEALGVRITDFYQED